MITWHYQRSLSQDIVDQLEPGDMILSGNYNGIIGWLIMYLTDSVTSHVMIYAGDGKVWHSTTKGSVLEPLASQFGWGKIFLPVKFVIKGKNTEFLEDWIDERAGAKGYNYKRVISLGLRLLLCVNPNSINLKCFYDVCIVSIALFAIFLLSGWTLIAILFLAYPAMVLIFHEICCRLNLQGRMDWTPGEMEKVIFMDPQMRPMINIMGFRTFMLSVFAHNEALGNINPDYEGSLDMPEGLRVRVRLKQRKSRKRSSFFSRTEIK